MKKLINKKWFLFGIFHITVLVLGLAIGLGLLFGAKFDQFLFVFLISYPFSLWIYFSFMQMYSLNGGTTEKQKRDILIYSISRYLCMFVAVGLSLLYLYLTQNMGKPGIYFILVSPSVLAISLLGGAFLAKKGENWWTLVKWLLG